MQHTIGNISTTATTLIKTSSQSKVCRQSYGPPKLQESQLWEFQDSHLGDPGQNAIWVLVPWPSIKYTIRGKVVASPKSGAWWILWVWVCPWFVLTPKVFKLCTKQLFVWFVQVHVSIWLLVILPNLIPELQHTPLPPKCYEPKSVPKLLTISLFSLHTHIWIYQGAWECVICIPVSNCSNYKCKVFITFQLGLHVEKDGPHTPCSHAKKPKNVTRG